MSEQPVASAARTDVTSAAAPAWFGKIPSLGDFVSRRTPHGLASLWDAWIRQGLEHMRLADGDQAWKDRFIRGPLWYFHCPALVTGVAVVGAIAPSMDRVGRYYPLTVFAPVPASFDASEAAKLLPPFLTQVGHAILVARSRSLSAEELDRQVLRIPPPFRDDAQRRPSNLIGDILENLGDASGLEGAAIWIPDALDLRPETVAPSRTSVWWTTSHPTASVPSAPRQWIHSGPLCEFPFSQLF